MAADNKPRDPATNRTARKQIETLSGQNISACFQCEKCTNGCPLNFAMDISPHQAMHCIQLGLTDEVIDSDTIWVCASCETCTTRCPNEIDIARVMDTLRQLSVQKGVKASQKQAPIFHKAFLDNIKRSGRMHELTMGIEFALKSEGLKGLLKQSGLGMNMIRKGKMKIIPDRARARKDIQEIFRQTEEK
jgi:heterodisulfide reductase subunit C